MIAGVTVLAALLATGPHGTQAETKPADASIGGFPKRLALDTRRLFTTRTPALILAAGGVAALAVHPADTAIESHTPKFGTLDEALDAGSVAGDGWVQWTAAGVVYGAGLVLRKPAVADLGTRLVEAQVIGGVTTQIIKYAVNRQRPDGGRYSFPSGHTEASFVTADVLQQQYGWRVGAFAYAAAACVSVSRLAEHEHYLSDVVFGAAVGIASARTLEVHARGHALRVTAVPMPGGAAVFVHATPHR